MAYLLEVLCGILACKNYKVLLLLCQPLWEKRDPFLVEMPAVSLVGLLWSTWSIGETPLKLAMDKKFTLFIAHAEKRL